MNNRKLDDKLTDAFIKYQYRLDHPMPNAKETSTVRVLKYQSDYIFHAKVRGLVSGIMQIIIAHLEEEDEREKKMNETMRRKLANLINDDWLYSMHWKEDTWRYQAKEDIKRAMVYANKRVVELKKADKLLINNGEREEEDETDNS